MRVFRNACFDNLTFQYERSCSLFTECSGFPSAFSVGAGPDRAGQGREADIEEAPGRGNGGWGAL